MSKGRAGSSSVQYDTAHLAWFCLMCQTPRKLQGMRHEVLKVMQDFEYAPREGLSHNRRSGLKTNPWFIRVIVTHK